MAYEFFDHTGDVGVHLTAPTLGQLFGSATEAFTDTLTEVAGVEPKRAEEVEVDAPDLNLLLVDYLSELLYRFDTRGWLTRHAEVDVREQDGSWVLMGSLRGERFDESRHGNRILIKAVTYHGLDVRHEAGMWRTDVVFDI